MKQFKFKTNKGDFLLIDEDSEGKVRHLQGVEYLEIGRLRTLTEEQASEIVDYPFELEVADSSVLVFKDYEDDENTYTSSIDSLYSLLKSKGIHFFENPYTNSTDLNSSFFSMQTDFKKEKEAEMKTFYNPILFKINVVKLKNNS